MFCLKDGLPAPEFGDLLLSVGKNLLEEVVVRAMVPLVFHRPDRVVFAASGRLAMAVVQLGDVDALGRPVHVARVALVLHRPQKRADVRAVLRVHRRVNNARDNV